MIFWYFATCIIRTPFLCLLLHLFIREQGLHGHEKPGRVMEFENSLEKSWKYATEIHVY